MNKKLLLISIILLAAFLRLHSLGSYPALNADEAAIGYNAKSLLETGMDEHGHPWPIHFQSFNDWKPGLYFYLVMPFIRVLGLTELSVRLPNALLGIATVFLVYLLTNEVCGDKTKKHTLFDAGLVSAFFLAISPWHIHFSRGGWEVNTATFLITLGVYSFIKSVSNGKYLFLSATAFVLSLYTYHAARIISPLLLLALTLIYRKDLFRIKKYVIIAFMTGLILVIPLAKDMLRPEISSRAAGVGLFADPGPVNRINEQRSEHLTFNSIGPRILHNKAVNYTLAFFENWAAHYHGLFLFLSGDDIQRDKIPETGQMYLFDILLLPLGLYVILKKGSREKNLILYWLLFAPVAAALTFQSPHALRSENMVIPLVIISSLGLSEIIETVSGIKSKKTAATLFLIMFLVIGWNLLRYLHMYWGHMSKEYPYSSQYGVKELAGYLENNFTDKKVLITTRYDQPYILLLFYMNYPPTKFQANHQLTTKDKYGFSTVDGFDRFRFKPIDWESDKTGNPDALIVGADNEIPDEANIISRIKGTNGFEYFKIVAN